jgi:LmbE family N-acetylglucosaminyl deacetylase
MDAPEPHSAERFLLRALETLGQDVMFVGAHPDDETFALGGHLPRLPRADVVIVTDGAPRDLRDAGKLGFRTAEEYAAARAREMRAALALAGLAEQQLIELHVPDQQAALVLPQLTNWLAELFRSKQTWLVLTHAYEGGHPDHDAVAFAVHAARHTLDAAGEPPPVLIEMPYYRQAAHGSVVQGFDAEDGVYVAELNDAQLALKTEIMNCHASQLQLFGRSSAGFRTRHESFRLAPAYDFSEPPNGGRRLYEAWGLNVTGTQWQDEAARALAQLGMPP